LPVTDPAPPRLLRGGLLVDGTGAPPWLADVTVVDGRIAAIDAPGSGAELGRADEGEVIDCTGRVVAPGFVDIHTHSDVTRLRRPAAESRAVQGVTTEVVGNCGLAPAPCGPDPQAMRADMGPIDQLGGAWPWRELSDYLDEMAATPAGTNVAVLAGHGALRHGVGIAGDRRAEAAEVALLVRAADEALDAGCVGVSLGLMYSPGQSAAADELDAVASCVADHGALLTVHLRDYATDELERSVAEMLEVARRTGARLQLSHLRSVGRAAAPSARAALELVDASGLDVGVDAYPYIAGHTTLVQLVEPGLRARGVAAVVERCRSDPASVAAGIAASPFRGDDVIVAGAPGGDELLGRSLAQLAEAAGVGWSALAVELLARFDGQVDMIVFGSEPAEADAVLDHPRTVIASDGAALPLDHRQPLAHPRSIGTFPRAIRGLLDRGTPLEAAVAKATSGPADRVGLDRGRLRVGDAADVVVFDPATLADAATYSDPLVPPTGIDWVLVGGVPVLRRGRPTGARPGMLLRRARP